MEALEVAMTVGISPRMSRGLTASLLTLLVPGAAATAATALGTLTEYALPPYQRAALTKDLPVHDLALSEADGGQPILTLLGQSALWQWRLTDRSLRRLHVGTRSPTTDGSEAPATKLGSDGGHAFAAGTGVIYRCDWDTGKVFRFDSGAGHGMPLTFAGSGDQLTLILTQGLLRLDPYGKAIRALDTIAPLKAGDLVAFDAKSGRLWRARGRQLRQYLIPPDLASGAPRRPAAEQLLFKASHDILGLAYFDGHLLVHTAHTVLSLGDDGSLLRAIPVEGPRRLMRAIFNRGAHAYVFDDGLLEIYRPDSKAVERYRLPLAEDDHVTPAMPLTFMGSLLAIAPSGHPHVYSIKPGP